MGSLHYLWIYVRRLLIGVTAAYIVASFAFGGSSAARPVFYCLTGAWCILSALGLVSGPCASARLAGWVKKVGAGNRLRRAFSIVELVAFNIALTLVLSEGGLRVLAGRARIAPIVSDSLNAYLLEPGCDYSSGLRGNSLGFPGPDFQRAKTPGGFRIAALGDSFAVGPAVAYGDNYLHLLEKSLPATEVYNFGVSGTGPREYHLLLQKHVRGYRPDLVLVSVFVGNDVTESLATPRQMDPRQLSLYCLVKRGTRLLREHWRRVSEKGSDPLVSGGLTPFRTQAGTLSLETFRQVEARRLMVCLNPPPAELEKKWQRTFTHLGHLVDDCKRWKLPVAFVLIPDEFQVNAVVLADALRAGGFESSPIDLSFPQRRLSEYFAERGVPCLDLLPYFKDAPDTYAPRNTHWNERGNHLAAELIADWLTTGRSLTLNLPVSGPPRPGP